MLAQKLLDQSQSITLPHPDDKLWIVTDGLVKRYSLGATLYVMQQGRSKPLLAGFFSAKLKQRQLTWIPCEMEALCIASAVKHFAPYVIQSHHQPQVLTDSKPCVQAFHKLARGEFSVRAGVSSFLTVASRYHIAIQHLAGSANLPQVLTLQAETHQSVRLAIVRFVTLYQMIRLPPC